MAETAPAATTAEKNLVDRAIAAISKALSYGFGLSILVTVYDVVADVVFHSPTVWVYDVVTTAIAVAFPVAIDPAFEGGRSVSEHFQNHAAHGAPADHAAGRRSEKPGGPVSRTSRWQLRAVWLEGAGGDRRHRLSGDTAGNRRLAITSIVSSSGITIARRGGTCDQDARRLRVTTRGGRSRGTSSC